MQGMPARDRLGWFRFNPRDWLTDTVVQQAMTADQRGRYINVVAWLYLADRPGVATEQEGAPGRATPKPNGQSTGRPSVAPLWSARMARGFKSASVWRKKQRESASRSARKLAAQAQEPDGVR